MSTDSNNIFYNLGLTSKDIKCIEYSFPNDLDRQAFEGLIKWRDQTDMMIKDSEYMIAELNTAFIEVKRQDLVDYINNLTGMFCIYQSLSYILHVHVILYSFP